MGLDAMILVFWMLSFKPTFSLSFLTFIKRMLCLRKGTLLEASQKGAVYKPGGDVSPEINTDGTLILDQ